MGGAVGELPSNRGEHPLGRWWARLSHVEQHERPGAVGVLRHARVHTRLAEQRRLLIAGDPADRNAFGNPAVGSGGADVSTRRDDLGQRCDRNTDQLAQLGVPRTRSDVAQHRPTRIGHVGDESATSGEVPHEPRIDRADGEVVVDGDVAVLEQPCRLRPGEVGIDHEAGAFADHPEVARRLQFVTASCRSAVLPHDGGAIGVAGRAVPGEHGFALVRDANGGHVRPADLVDDVAQGLGGHVPDLRRVVFDPTGRGVVLSELAVGGNRGTTVDEDRTAADPGGSGIDGDHASRLGARGHQRFLRLDDLGRLAPPAVRLVGAGLCRGASSAVEVDGDVDGSADVVADRRASFSRVRW